MSISVSNPINYAVLFPNSTGSSTNIASNILSIAYGNGTTSGSGTSSMDPILALQIAQANEKQDVAQEAKTPEVSQDIAAFTKAVQNATSPTQLLSNPTVLKVLLTANGLGSDTSYTALAQKALLSNVNDPKGLANQLSSTNSEWLSTAQTYDFANKGLSVIQQPSVISTITSGYAEVLWRQSLDSQTPGLSDALDLIQNASKFTSADQILGDSVMRNVVTTAYGIPQQIAFQDLGAQEKAITDHLDISKLQDPKFVQNLADLYLTQVQASSSSSSSSSTSLTSLAIQSQSLVA